MVTDSLLRSVRHEEVTFLLALWVTPQGLLSFWLVAKSLFEECCLNKGQYALHERNDRNIGIWKWVLTSSTLRKLVSSTNYSSNPIWILGTKAHDHKIQLSVESQLSLHSDKMASWDLLNSRDMSTILDWKRTLIDCWESHYNLIWGRGRAPKDYLGRGTLAVGSAILHDDLTWAHSFGREGSLNSLWVIVVVLTLLSFGRWRKGCAL